MYLYKIRTHLLRAILEKVINRSIIPERHLHDSSVYKLEAHNLIIYPRGYFSKTPPRQRMYLGKVCILNIYKCCCLHYYHYSA